MQFASRWREAMDDDFNTAKVIGQVFEYVRAMNAYIDKKGFKPTPFTGTVVSEFINQIKTLSSVLNIFGEDPSHFLAGLKRVFLEENGVAEKEITEAIQRRTQARAAKDFKTADEIRSQLLARGIELRDLAAGTDWDIVLTSET